MTPRRRRGTPPGPRRRPARPTLSLAEEEELEGQQGDKVGNLLGKSSKPRPSLPPLFRRCCCCCSSPRLLRIRTRPWSLSGRGARGRRRRKTKKTWRRRSRRRRRFRRSPRRRHQGRAELLLPPPLLSRPLPTARSERRHPLQPPRRRARSPTRPRRPGRKAPRRGGRFVLLGRLWRRRQRLGLASASCCSSPAPPRLRPSRGGRRASTRPPKVAIKTSPRA